MVSLTFTGEALKIHEIAAYVMLQQGRICLKIGCNDFRRELYLPLLLLLRRLLLLVLLLLCS
jgi:hypothetical protein